MIASRLRRCAPAVVVVAVAAGLAGCSSTLSDAATVHYPRGGEGADTMHVDLTDFQKELREVTASAKFRDAVAQAGYVKGSESDLDSAVASAWLGNLVNQASVDRIFEARKLKLTSDDIATATREITSPQEGDTPLLVSPLVGGELYKSFSNGLQRTIAERRARADVVLKSYANPTLNDIQSFYDTYKDDLACRRVAHILVKTEGEAQDVLAQLKRGKSFAELAKTRSTDRGSASNGGDVGCLSPGAFVEEFQNAAESGPLDTPIGPVKTQFGYHVLQIHRTVPAFDAMRMQLIEAMKQGAAVKESIATAKVTVNPRFGSPGGVTVNQQTNVLEYQLRSPVVPEVATNRDPTTTTTPASLPQG